MLMAQYLACVDKKRPTGIIVPDLDAAALCRDSRDIVVGLCERLTGTRPVVDVQVFSAAKEDMVPGCAEGVPRFSYIPEFLDYIMRELLKNSCRATLEALERDGEASSDHRPIQVVVCADEHHVTIRVSYRGRGIPHDVGQRVWSYLYSTAHGDRRSPSELAGFGVGLPISRLYALYFGGSLNLVSLPGYGTDAYIFLPRLDSEQVEVVPDKDHSCKYSSMSDFVL